MTWKTSEQVEEEGYFQKFNDGKHLCIDAPLGHFTISVRTREGKKITFAFLPECNEPFEDTTQNPQDRVDIYTGNKLTTLKINEG